MTGFARAWSEFVAALADHVYGGVPGLFVLLLLLAFVGFLALAWRPKFRRPTWPKRRKKKIKTEKTVAVPEESAPAAAETLPDLPQATLLSLADRYAAEGRYAEAVRERLRAILRGLVERGVIENLPGSTVTELAGAAGRALGPAVAGPLAEATGIFSDLWYGERPATAGHDARMRELSTMVGIR